MPPTDTLTARKVKKIVYVARVYCGENGDGHCPYLLPLLNTPVNYAVRTVTACFIWLTFSSKYICSKQHSDVNSHSLHPIFFIVHPCTWTDSRRNIFSCVKYEFVLSDFGNMNFCPERKVLSYGVPPPPLSYPARNAVVVMTGALVGYTLTTQAWFSGQLTLISTERFPLPHPQPPNVTLHSVKVCRTHECLSVLYFTTGELMYVCRVYSGHNDDGLNFRVRL